VRTAGGASAQAAGALLARASAIFANVRRSLAVIIRSPRSLPAQFVPVWRRFPMAAAITAAAIALAMMFLDTPAFKMSADLPDWLVDLSFVITDFGRSGWILVPVGGLILAIGFLASPRLDYMNRAVLAMAVTRLGFIFIAVGLPGLIDTIVKRWIGRARPSALGPFAYEPFAWRPEFASFPSGHATTAFAALVAIGAVFPRARPALWIYALLIAASRILIAAHYPSDVVAGAAVGAFGALWVRDWFAVRRLGFYVGPDGAVHAMAGPSWRRIKQVAGAVFRP
jgi:membrane-associated phospholipid phosphatase